MVLKSPPLNSQLLGRMETCSFVAKPESAKLIILLSNGAFKIHKRNIIESELSN